MKIELAKTEIIHFIGIGGIGYEWAFFNNEREKVLKYKAVIYR